jgi:hypothetical protein
MNEKIEKIVELDIDDDMLDEEFESTGVQIVSIVDQPAIKEDFLYFNTDEFITPNPCQSGYVAYGTKIKDGREVPNCIKVDNTELVEPNAGEGHDEYMSRCIAYEIDEGKEQEQAIAICHSKWEAVHGTTEMSEEYEFESYNDYPKAARENACRAVIHADEEGWGSCGTAVGKKRASQLCMGQNISRDTIARMAAFARHAQHKDVPYDEGCGGLMYDAWGGEEGIAWAQRKLDQIDREKEEMSKHSCKKDKNGKCKYATEEEQRAILDFAEDDNNGIYLGVDDIFLDFTKTSFGIGDVLKSISGLDILKRLAIKKDEPAETYWRYSGPSPQRDFCKAMMRLSNRGKIFTTEEINKMNNVSNLNPGMGKGGSDFYSVLQYAGGVSCTHYLQKLKVFKGDNGKKVIIATNQTDNEEEVNAMKSQNSNQPGPLGSIANNARVNFNFNLDEEKRIVTGALMIPNKFILRMSEDGSPFYIYFSRKTIRKMAEKFFRMNNHNNTDINHDENVTNDNTLIESWISESIEHDKSYKYGFRLPPGTWFVSYKINDDDTWEKIKSGELKGFSLAGGFIQKMKRVDPEKKLNEIKDILKNVTDD